jgi:hypothetical protein
LNADVHSARAHLKRSSCLGYEVGKSRKEVLHVVWEDFFHKRVEKQKGFYSEASLLELLKKNRYFQEWIRSAAGNEMIYNSFNSKGFVGGSSLSAFDKIP